MSSAILRAACAALLASIFALPSQAATLGIANDYNAFIFGNLNAAGGDTEGRLAVGTNFTASNYGVGVTLTNSGSTRDDLIVGGNMNAIGGWQVFNGNAVYGTTLTAAPTTPNGSTFQGAPVDFAAAHADLLAKSAYWATLPATGTSVFQFSTLTLSGNNPLLNVFQVTEAAWENSSDKQINIPVGSTVLINIAGTNVAFNGGLAINGQQNQFDPAIPGILYNFASATTLQPSNIAVLGSVLAPLADLTLTGGNINGITVVANALTLNGGEFHNRGFTGTLPNPPVPEPCSVALVLGGVLIGAVGVRRR